MKNIFHIGKGLFLLTLSLVLASCSDSIADQVAGKWQRDYGADITGTYTFTRDDNKAGGGTLVYNRVVNDTTSYDSGIMMTATVEFSLQGRWYIDDDAYDVPCDLHISYDLNSVKVNANNMTYHDTDGTTYSLNEVASMFDESADELKTEYVNEWADGVRKGFKNNNEGDTFSGFTIVSLDEHILKAEILSDTDKKDSQETKNDTIVYRRIQ